MVRHTSLSLRAENFVNLNKLRFLRLNDEDIIDGSFKHLLPNLRWLSLRRMKVERFNATNFNFKKLVVLNLSYSNITESWVGWKEFKDLPCLEVFDLSCCHGLKKTPDLSHCTSLKKLYLAGCSKLEEIDCSITGLPKLHILDVSYCGSIESLPDSIGETMVLQLTELDIYSCERLKKLSGFISKQKKLQVLCADWTKEIKWIPSEIEESTCLREMSFDYSSICGMPSLVKLTRLEKLSLSECDHLQQLPAQLPTSLVQLRVISTSLRSIPDYSNLINLTKLEFMLAPSRGDLEELEELNLSWMWRLSNLKSLDLWFSSSFVITTTQSEEPSVSLLSQLEQLTLSCSVLGTCVLPSCLSALTSLYISLYRKTTSLSLPRMNCLKHFRLGDSDDLEQILGLGELKSLVSLEIRWCKSLERLDDISKLTQLQTLNIIVCKKLRVIPGVPGLRSLQKLEIVRCESLESLVGPSESESCLYDMLRVIKRWKIIDCPLLENKLPHDLKRTLDS